MESRILTMPDYQAEIKAWPWSVDEAAAATQEQVYQICLKHKYYEEQSRIEDGDIVTLNMQGAEPPFNRPIPVRVGAGLLDRAFEQSLIGHTKEDKLVFMRKGAGIPCSVQRITRLIVPGLSDEIAAAETLDGITTARQLYDHYYHKAVYDTMPKAAKSPPLPWML